MENTDKEKTVFSTPNGHYEYNKMPLGLKKCTRDISKILLMASLTPELCMVYLDDIIVFNSGSPDEHIQQLSKVFNRLQNANIKLKPKKCHFLLKKLST